MSGAIVGGTAGATAAAAARAAKMRDEEENMTKYNGDELEKWEFKIVRSNFARFKNYQVVQKLCAEEARAGWELLEKFDDSRIRFKRPIDKRAYDQHLDIDPYRTTMSGEGKYTFLIIGIIVMVTGMAIALALTLKH